MHKGSIFFFFHIPVNTYFLLLFDSSHPNGCGVVAHCGLPTFVKAKNGFYISEWMKKIKRKIPCCDTWKVHEIQISAFLDAGFLAHRQPHSFTYHLWLLSRCNGWVGKLGQIVSPGEPEIFPTWPFTEGISQPYPVIRPWDPLSCIISATHFADKETEAQHR